MAVLIDENTKVFCQGLTGAQRTGRAFGPVVIVGGWSSRAVLNCTKEVKG